MTVIVDQVTLPELLTYPGFRKYFRKRPKVTDLGTTPQWRLFVLIDGRWQMKEVENYDEAFRFVARNLRRIEDGAIANKRHRFKEPFRVPHFSDHLWCAFCRRPTVFLYFEKHHFDRVILRTLGMLASEYRTLRRCSVCGTPEREVLAFQRTRDGDEE
jgi:hypothetical protein